MLQWKKTNAQKQILAIHADWKKQIHQNSDCNIYIKKTFMKLSFQQKWDICTETKMLTDNIITIIHLDIYLSRGQDSTASHGFLQDPFLSYSSSSLHHSSINPSSPSKIKALQRIHWSWVPGCYIFRCTHQSYYWISFQSLLCHWLFIIFPSFPHKWWLHSLLGHKKPYPF